MEEIMSIMFNGINLVKELEFSLSSQESSPESLSISLGSISTLFGDANERLKILLAGRNGQPEPKMGVSLSDLDQMMMQIEPAGLMQDYCLTHGMMQTVENMDFGAGSHSSTTRNRKRKKDGEEETVLVAATRMGKIEIPPDDKYTWRKYGQKEILGSRFPRAYYRCSHQKLYECPAKKQVQRLDEDPCMFRVTYRSSHTCHFFTTSPISSTTANVGYGPGIVSMAEAMFGNLDSIVPLAEPH